MSMKRLTLVLGLVALVSLAVPLSAAPRGGGGRGGGGGHHGGGGYHGGGGGYRGGHGGYRGGHGGYYGGRWGWGWGWGWGWPYYGYSPYWYGYAGYPGYYGYGYPYGSGYGPATNWAVVDTDVSPESARVYLDGTYIGTADDFDGFPDYLYLQRGEYRLEFRLDGFETRTIGLEARPGTQIDVDEKLGRIAGAAHYGSYDTPEPAGGVRRFWGKRNHSTVEITEEDMYGEGRRYSDDRYRDDRYRDDRYRERDEEYAVPNPDDRYREGDRGYANEPPRQEEWRGNSPAANARLLFHVRPSDASIYVDGRYIGKASELSPDTGIALAPGRHKIAVSAPGYRERLLEVDLARGESENVEVNLER
jgi:hypothetical protein